MIEKLQLEVCVATIQSALAAQEGGASRIELCDNLYEGGTTPSYAAIKTARKLLSITVMVMIRPRGADFCYSRDELEIMKEDIRICRELGVDGVVFGILQPDGHVDIAQCRKLVDCSRPLQVTFHRAFDMTPDPYRALEDVISTGADRLLTSGHKNKASDGLELIRELVKQAGDRIKIMPGSGINETNIRYVRDETGASEFHLTGRRQMPGVMKYRKSGLFMGGLPEIPEYDYFHTDPERIRQAVDELKKL